MWSALWTALLIGLPALLVNAQTETVVNAAGQTVVEVISLNAAGIPETQILSTVLSSSSAASSSTAALTSSTTPAVTTPTTTPPAVQGPVGQPAPTALAPTPTQYVYTTTNALGQTTAVQDVFTPSFAPTTTPAPGTSGTIINFIMTTPSEVVALVCVVDTSLAIIIQWEQLLQEYVIPLLQRLKDLHPKRVFRVGFVSYATAETRPTPLVTKVFFGPPQVLIAKLRDDPRKLGIGQTGPGAYGGMAALEGLVAALELFDTLRSSIEVKASHIVHIAASPPDTADRPLWNLTPLLDSASWDTLPTEFRKRDINYSNILLKQISQFSDLQSTTALGATQIPWFQVRAKHAIHLSGFPSPQQQKGAKRTGEGTPVTDRSPEAKRARIQPQPPQSSPKTIHTTPQSVPAVPPPLNQSGPSIQPHPAPAIQNSMLAQSKQALERIAQFEQALNQKLQQADAHEAAGRLPEATALRQQVQTQRGQIANFKRAFEEKARAAGAQSQAHPQVLPAGGAGQSVPPPAAPVHTENAPLQASVSAPQLKPSASSASDSGPSFPDPSMSDPPIAPPSNMQHRPNITSLPPSASGGSIQQMAPPSLQLTSSVSPQISAQMQKLIEQRNRGPHLSSPQVQSQPPPQPPPQSQPQPQSHPENAAGANASPTSGQPAAVWKGIFTWRGFDMGPQGRNQAVVTIHANQNAEQLRTDTWPSGLTLTPSPDPVVPLVIMQDWTKRKNGAIIYVLPHTQSPEGKVNGENFAAFLRHLVDKPCYALVAWNGPLGLPENHILLFPAKNVLAGAVFPGVMPELPKAEILGIQLTQLQPAHALMLSKLGPDHLAQMAVVPKEKRIMWLQAFIGWMQKMQQQQHPQALGQGQGQQQQQSPQLQQMSQQPPLRPQPQTTAVSAHPLVLNPFVATPNIGGFIDGLTNRQSMQKQQPQQNPMGGMNIGDGMGTNNTNINTGLGQMSTMSMPPGGMHQRTPSGGNVTGIPGLSMEMLQSFMQRNQQGGGGPPGMGS
ncbi:hypothetical protein B0H21DRAFT_893420 [Amylocystis lapponica]|nr:hypothetical protein B0H21DRAFT_893420 [Amylocystis lapponica]